MSLPFETDSPTAWKDRILKELKGAPLSKAISQTREGIDIAPFYTKADKVGLIETQVDQPWRILQEFDASPGDTNSLLLESLKAGVDSISLSSDDYEGDLDGVHPEMIELEVGGEDFHPRWMEYLSSKDLNPRSLRGGYAWDPLGGVILTGQTQALEVLPQVLQVFYLQVADWEHWHLINVGGDVYYNAGATAVQELAYTLLMVQEYVKGEKGIAHCLRVTLAAGTDYFETSCKLRAFRILWANLMDYHGLDIPLIIQARSTSRDFASGDSHSNLLRGTSQCMAAVVGGADRIALRPFDGKESAFSLRMARNIQKLLIHESYFDKSMNPMKGAYVFETYTEELSCAAWNLFKETEQDGGWSTAVKKGTIQSAVLSSAERWVEEVNSGAQTWLGVNKHPLPTESKWPGLAVLSKRGGLPVIHEKDA